MNCKEECSISLKATISAYFEGLELFCDPSIADRDGIWQG